MVTLCIRYVIDVHKHQDFETYARHWPAAIRRCGGDLIGYFLPTKSGGPTNIALALIEFPNVAAHEQYREALKTTPRHERIWLVRNNPVASSARNDRSYSVFRVEAWRLART